MLKRIGYHFKFWLVKSKMHFQVYFAYKLEWIGYFLTWVLGTIFAVVFYRIIFSQVSNIRGWEFEDMILLYSVDMLVWSLFMVFFFDSLFDEYRDAVRTGKLDQHILKPLNKRVSVSIGRIDVPGLFNASQALIMITILHFLYDYSFSLIGIILGLFLVFNGVLILYNFLFFMYTISFWATDFRRADSLFWEINDVSGMPTNIYPKILQVVFFVLFPAALVAFIPFQAMLGLIDWWIVVAAIFVNVVFFLLTQKMFESGLRRYSGVSS